MENAKLNIHNIECPDCKVMLTSILVTASNEVLKQSGMKPLRSRFKAKCFKCGNYSFLTPIIEGRTSLGMPEDGQTTVSVEDTTIKDGVIISSIAINKKDKK